jgi:hypothetical protein
MAGLIDAFSGLWWLLAALLPLLYLQRRLHTEIIAVFLLLTRRQGAALAIFSIIFFPGVLVHELSHWLMARLLRVRTGRIWLIPELLPDGKLRMGYVETSKVDPLRDGLIGAAPIFGGGALVAFAGLTRLNLHLLWQTLVLRQGDFFLEALKAIYTRPDFWLWFYLLFVISSMMLPSETDRRAWLPIAIFSLILLVFALLAGAGSWLLDSLAPVANAMFGAAAAVFGISVLVHGLLLLPIFLVRRLLNRLTGLQVAY